MLGAKKVKPLPHNLRQVRLLTSDEACDYGWLDNIAIVIGRGSPTEATIPNFARCLRELALAYPEGIGLVCVAQPNSTPAANAREPLIRAFRSSSKRMSAAVFVVHGEGFGAAIQRSIMSAAMLTMGGSDGVRVVSELGKAMPWFAEKMKIPHRIDHVEESITRFMAEVKIRTEQL